MTAFLQILQTVGLNAALLGIIKAISLLYRYYTRGTVRIQEKDNIRHGLPATAGIRNRPPVRERSFLTGKRSNFF